MVIKIFYLFIAIFSLLLVFLLSSDPYLSEAFKQDNTIANMQANDVLDYEINATSISGIYEADVINRYAKHDEAQNFKARIIRGDQLHSLSSNKALLQGDVIKFIGEARYENNQSLTFNSDEINYNQKSKKIWTDVEFEASRMGDRTIGKSIEYDINAKQTRAKGIRAWVEQ